VDQKYPLYLCGASKVLNEKYALRLIHRLFGYSASRKKEHIDRNNLLQYIAPQDLRAYGLIPEIVGRLQ